jgi:hypothetical protein
MFDTNVWIDVSRGQIRCRDLREKVGTGLVLSPLTITELVRGSVNGNEENFARDQQMFKCMVDGSPEMLELPKVFVYKILWNLDWGVSGVRPHHYRTLLEMLISSKTLFEFLRKAEAPGGAWTKITQLHSIHESVLEKELKSLQSLAQGASLKALPVHISLLYACGGLIADPAIIEQRFSAAIEYLRTSILRVRQGAKPWKNDPGSYVDSQFFWYLADPRIVPVTKEDFSDDIRVSSQRTQIISYDAFSREQ